MYGILLILVILFIFFMYRRQSHRRYNGYSYDSDDESECRTLNDMDTSYQMHREPIYDDTSRINNQLYWMSEYSHPSAGQQKNLNDDIITPVRAVSGRDAIEYYSGMHNVSRFGCEPSV